MANYLAGVRKSLRIDAPGSGTATQTIPSSKPETPCRWWGRSHKHSACRFLHRVLRCSYWRFGRFLFFHFKLKWQPRTPLPLRSWRSTSTQSYLLVPLDQSPRMCHCGFRRSRDSLHRPTIVEAHRLRFGSGQPFHWRRVFESDDSFHFWIRVSPMMIRRHEWQGWHH